MTPSRLRRVHMTTTHFPVRRAGAAVAATRPRAALADLGDAAEALFRHAAGRASPHAGARPAQPHGRPPAERYRHPPRRGAAPQRQAVLEGVTQMSLLRTVTTPGEIRRIGILGRATRDLFGVFFWTFPAAGACVAPSER